MQSTNTTPRCDRDPTWFSFEGGCKTIEFVFGIIAAVVAGRLVQVLPELQMPGTLPHALHILAPTSIAGSSLL
jgi:hypothetical protein